MSSRGRSVGTGPRPVLRGMLLAALSTLLTSLGHLAGGGTLPDLGLLVVLFPLLAVAVTSLADRARGRVGTVLVLGAGQLVLHELLVTLGHGHGAGPVDGPRMAAMHAVATVGSGLLLAHVDALLTLLATALRRILPPPRPTLRVDVAVPVVAPRPAGHVRRAVVGTIALRGPPVPVAP